MSPLPAFTAAEVRRTRRLLAAHVAYMMGRKLEEADWSDVYCAAKGIPQQGWSNLNLDVMHGPLGLELKMLGRPATVPITRDCGTTLMHPALTRAIRIDSLDSDPNDVMQAVFRQYAELVTRRTASVAERNPGVAPDMRIGWLLWQTSLRQFLYFEQRMEAPDPGQFRAIWNQRGTTGSRLGSKNLWIYEVDTNKKRYSITTQAGIKIQPYFDVPAMDDPHVYIFTVQGEELEDGRVRMWATQETARGLERIIGSLDTQSVSEAILSADPGGGVSEIRHESDLVREIIVSLSAYERLAAEFEGVNDELKLRSLLAQLHGQM